MSVEEATCYRWSCDFVMAHAVFASGFVTAPVAVFHLVKRPHSGHALFFAMFAVLGTTVSLVLCCSFYSELKRPPCWPPRRQRQQHEDAGARHESSTREDLRRPEIPVMVRPETMAGRVVPSYYEHRDDDDGDDDAADCAVCLGELEKGQAVRRLPACRHVFHEECVDAWLRARAHATCPVCRRGVLPERSTEVVVVVTVDAAAHGPPDPVPDRVNI